MRSAALAALLCAAACQRAAPRGDDAPHELVIRVQLPGATTAQADRELGVPVEAALRTIPGVARTETRSRGDLASVTLGFKTHDALIAAREEVGAKLTTVAIAGETVAPWISVGREPGDRTMWFVLRGEPRAAERVRRRLEVVRGVRSVTMCGVPEEEILVEVGPRGSPLAVHQALLAENVAVPAGQLDRGGQVISVRTRGELRDLEELGNLAIADGLRLSDVATISVARTPDECRALAPSGPVGGTPVAADTPVAAGTIVARAEATSELRAHLRTLATELPAGTHLELLDAAESMTVPDGDARTGHLMLVEDGAVTVVPAVPGTPGARVRSDERVVTLTGESWEEVAAAARAVAERARAAGAGAAGVDGGSERPELEVVLARDRIAALGVSTSDVSTLVRIAVAGAIVSRLRGPDGESRPIRLRGDLERMFVGNGVPLTAVLERRETAVPVEIVRRDGAIVVDVWATPRTFDLRAQAKDLPAGVAIR